jgi:uncharacterized protein (DUF2252 family)
MAEPRYGSGARNTPGRTTAAKNGGASNGRASKGRAAAKPPARPAAKQSAKPPPAKPAAKPPAKELTPAERAARGKASRGQVPRESHAAFDPPPDRADPVSLLESQALTRVPELVPVRYGRMMVSPFTYYRGAALPMANDLATTPGSGLIVQACGDAHLSNFGLFASAERNLIFDVNDFDETLPAPWEWDVKRLAASLEVAARENGFGRKDRRRILLSTVARYRQAMRTFAGQPNLTVWYATADVDSLRAQFDSLLQVRQRAALDKSMAKVRTRDSMQALGKLCRLVDGEPQIISDPPLVVRLADLVPEQVESADFGPQLSNLIGKYRRTLQSDRRVLLEQYAFTDMARKVVGVGSVGTRCWIILMFGRDGSDPLFLQVKEAQVSVLAAFAGASTYANQGQRVVAGQRLMQASSDIFLGWQRTEELDGQSRDFYVRQLRDWKFSLNIETMTPVAMRLYGELCGWTLARAHARSGDRIAIAAYLGSSNVFDQAIAEFGASYADQNERDYTAFLDAVARGRVSAEAGL